MLVKTILGIFVSLIIAESASAACGDMSPRTFKGDDAVTLAYILKNSPIGKKTINGDDTTWTVTEMKCTETNRGVQPDLMPAYECKPPLAVGPITAMALFEALDDMDVMPDATTGHVNQIAKDISCTINKNGAGGIANSPTCMMTAAWEDECGND
ncbi:hypothetical protein [Bdellovibrio sp. HCB288]|uniref:hypothetical protein n=1 Tax=Bdellovibrio sp. HCB288 TaxID=3394355 RepID=UPI0039B51505